LLATDIFPLDFLRVSFFCLAVSLSLASVAFAFLAVSRGLSRADCFCLFFSFSLSRAGFLRLAFLPQPFSSRLLAPGVSSAASQEPTSCAWRFFPRRRRPTVSVTRRAAAGKAPALENYLKARGAADCTRDSAVGLTQCWAAFMNWNLSLFVH